MSRAQYSGNIATMRRTWREHEKLLNEHALELSAAELSQSLGERARTYESIKATAKANYVDPKLLEKKIAAIRWWQADRDKHLSELARWRPLFVLDSDSTPYSWGDAGYCIVLADERQVAKGKPGRLFGTVDVS